MGVGAPGQAQGDMTSALDGELYTRVTKDLPYPSIVPCESKGQRQKNYGPDSGCPARFLPKQLALPLYARRREWPLPLTPSGEWPIFPISTAPGKSTLIGRQKGIVPLAPFVGLWWFPAAVASGRILLLSKGVPVFYVHGRKSHLCAPCGLGSVVKLAITAG